MPAPAVNITTAASPVPRSSPTDTGVAYVVGMSTQGPSRLLTGADKVTSLNDWITRYGGGSLANARSPTRSTTTGSRRSSGRAGTRSTTAASSAPPP
jgi:hypothetical protein